MGILEGNPAAREAVVIAAAVGVGFIVGFSMRHFVCKPLGRVNHKQQKDKAKVVDMVNMEDMGEKGVFCRCWKSGQFPYCDGTHETHNKITGDNVGPLIVKAKK